MAAHEEFWENSFFVPILLQCRQTKLTRQLAINQTFWLPSTILFPKKCTKRMRVFDPNVYAVGLFFGWCLGIFLHQITRTHPNNSCKVSKNCCCQTEIAHAQCLLHHGTRCHETLYLYLIFWFVTSWIKTFLWWSLKRIGIHHRKTSKLEKYLLIHGKWWESARAEWPGPGVFLRGEP